MRQTGQVVSVEGDVATVRFARSSACERCGACLHIGDKEAVTEVRNTLNAAEGDIVSVELHAKSFLEASLLAYVFPLVMLLAGLFLGSLHSDILSILLGLAFAGSAYLVLRLLEPRFKKSMRYRPRMISFEAELTDNNPCGSKTE